MDTGLAFASATLESRFTDYDSPVLLTGIQALVRVLLEQKRLDMAAGRNTGGFVSGYRGSPLGGLDRELWRRQKLLDSHNIKFQPGLNEDMAATMIFGTQQLNAFPGQTVDGVFGMWYGKGPGVDRSADAFRCANFMGTSPLGGVLAVSGDDHAAHSSTYPHQTDHIFQGVMIPILNPASAQDILDFGLAGLALSRFCGLWVAMKTTAETAEQAATIVVPATRAFVAPDLVLPPHGLNYDKTLRSAERSELERRVVEERLPAVGPWARANGIDRLIAGNADAPIGIITVGRAHADAMHALGMLDLVGHPMLAVYKVGLTWPIDAEGIRAFARGKRMLLVVEEKRSFVEAQIREALYNLPADARPAVVGKTDLNGQVLMPAVMELSPEIVGGGMARLFRDAGLNVADPPAPPVPARPANLLRRAPAFCAGCPHGTSTKLPDGSFASAGIGCHFMALNESDQTRTFTQMGGEGASWIGISAFTSVPHLFANIGDGTYTHSGLLAIRQAVAAKARMTYKILYNDAVAMTGGQQIGERPEGHSVLQIAQSMVAEGAAKISIVTDEPEKYASVSGLPAGIAIEHRDELDRIQRQFREIKGTTVIIYDQTCATEKRRRRKRGTLVDPAVRVVINELVCEGCGDCSVQSNCLSVEPLETEFGRKRQINQSTCNKDYSCLKGFCPSFVTVEGGKLKKRQTQTRSPLELGTPPDPLLPSLSAATRASWGVVVAGVGGTGVITIGQLLGMAAHLEGKGIVTQDAAGLAQKGGATWSHVLIGAAQDDIHTTRVGMASADLIIACDPVVAASGETLLRVREGRTHIALNAHATPTAGFVKNADWQDPSLACVAEISRAAGQYDAATPGVSSFDADAVATRLMGDSLYTNPVMLGYAWQKGWLPLQRDSLLRAIELNAVAVEQNKTAFEWGRHAAHDWAGVLALLGTGQVVQWQRQTPLDEVISHRAAFLTDYQNAAYAKSYQGLVARVQSAEAVLGKTTLTLAVAKNLFKLMSYKDEYEVARLHRDRSFLAAIAAKFEGDFQLHYHLAPPLLARRNERGELQKRKFGPATRWAFELLASCKGLRGTPLDIFGYTRERKQERALVVEYRDRIEEILVKLAPHNHANALQVALVPEQIKGFGHVKERSLHSARGKWTELMTVFRSGKA